MVEDEKYGRRKMTCGYFEKESDEEEGERRRERKIETVSDLSNNWIFSNHYMPMIMSLRQSELR